MSYGTSYVIRNSKSVISNDSILFPNLTLLKEHLNIVDSDFNNILEQYREMSIAEFLGYNGKTGLSIIKSEHVVDFNGFPQCSERVSLPNPPTKVVNSFFITYFDGYVQPVDISNFIINYSSEPTFLFPIIDWKSIITYNDSTPRFFTIKYDGNMDEDDNRKKTIEWALLSRIADRFERRSSFTMGVKAEEPASFTTQSMIDQVFFDYSKGVTIDDRKFADY